MAQATSSDGGVSFPGWFLKVMAIGLSMLVIISGVGISSWAQIGQNTRDISNHENRITKLEDKADEPSVLAERLDATNKRLDETNRRLDILLSRQEPRNGR